MTKLTPEYYNKLHQAAIANKAGHTREALNLCHEVIHKFPQHFRANLLLAAIYVNLREFDKALTYAEKAHKLDASNLNACQLVASLQQQLGSLNEAEKKLASYKKGFTSSIYFNETGYNALLQSKLEEAEKNFRQALVINPYYPKAHQNLATVLLANNDFDSGWREYEWRLKEAELKHHIHQYYTAFEWQHYKSPKNELQGKNILLHQEQGIGDTLMFAFCISDLSSMVNRLGIVCETRLHSIFRQSFPNLELYHPNASLKPNEFDYQICIGSLPGIFRHQLDDFKSHPYLSSDTGSIEDIKDKLGRLSSLMKIGVSWQGGSDEETTKLRSIPLESLSPIFKQCDAHFINLQHGNTKNNWDNLSKQFPGRLHQFADINPLENFEKYTALISELDLVISVDNSCVHFSGAMGKDTWVMLPHYCDWRWGISGSECYWYPSHRLFRAEKRNTWGEVITKVQCQLQKLIDQQPLKWDNPNRVKSSASTESVTKQSNILQGQPSEEYNQLMTYYKSTHSEGYETRETTSNQKTNSENTIADAKIFTYIDHIKQICDLAEAKSYLDYSAGKSLCCQKTSFKLKNGELCKNLSEYWGLEELSYYDPSSEAHRDLPQQTKDIVVCIDFLQNMPEQDIPWILRQIFSCATKAVFSSVSCYPAKAILPNGRNAHITLKSPEWWLDKWHQAQSYYTDIEGYLCCNLLDDSGVIIEKWAVAEAK